MPYATETEEALAKKLGYTITKSVEKGSRFYKEDRTIWSVIRDARPYWHTADLNRNGIYENHVGYTDLQEALRRPLQEG